MTVLSMRSRRSRLAWCAALLAGLICAGSAWAETALEKKIRDEAAPHMAVGSSEPTVVAHFATLIGFIEGNPGNAARLQALHETVERCVAYRRGIGAPIHAPTEWPEHLNGTREDLYVTDRFAITYFHSWIYGALNPDCSHQSPGDEQHTAVLKSRAGLCRIDLIAKTAKGQCDMDTHRNARLRSSAPIARDATAQVAGLRCQLLSDVLGDICVATDGRMTPTFPLVLSHGSALRGSMKAVRATLDIAVSERTFAPHLQGGFSVQEVKNSAVRP